MLAPPISPAPEPSVRASAPASDPSQHDATRPRASFREEVARSRERDATRATRSRPADREDAARDVEGRAERVDGDGESERAQDGKVRERPETEPRTEDAEGSSPAQRSTSETEVPVEPDSSPSKSEIVNKPTVAKANAPEQNALPLFLGWLPLQPAALVGASAPGVPADTGTPGALAAAVDGAAAPTLDASANAAPSIPVASTPSATAAAATTTPVAPSDVAPIAEMARTASAPDTLVPQAAEIRGAPTGNGAAIAEDLPKTAAPAAARLAPAELPGFLGQLEVHIDAPQRSAVVELEPLDLGRLSVELSIEPGNGVRAEVRAERQEGYAAIDARLAELRTALIERGFASVSVQLSLGFAEHRPRHSPAPGGSGTPAVAGPRTLSGAEVRALAPARDGAIDVWA